MVLLIVDAQRAITNEALYRFEKFVSNVKLLIDTARKCGIEVIYIWHDDGPGKPLSKGNEGFEIYDEFKPADGEKIFDKTVNSPFRDTGLTEYLRDKGETTLIIAGLQTDYCIDAAVKCGFEHGFHIIVPEYSNSTFDNEFMTAEESYKYYNSFMWSGRYADSVSMEETLRIMDMKGCNK
ncbi:MAG: cysteine hydrolase family protein [Huintestinicola sp.]|uniref:cysteine hydrolase family protein n=1 Tax=Huintestinicola sp. TaxID=2981661 RepID=UPI003F03C01D